MSVLARKPREGVLMDATDLAFAPQSPGNTNLQIRVMVKSVVNGQVEIAINAPRSVPILHEKLTPYKTFRN